MKNTAYRDHPRVCGEKLRKTAVSVRELGSPPRMRGKVGARGIFRFGPGITPAYAGKSHATVRCAESCWDHPRVCGEKIPKNRFRSGKRGSPPRMRGKVLCFRQVRQSGGITPAYAGKRYTYLIQMLCDRDHPRVCGEKGFSAFLGNCCAGSPPRMRGKADLCIGSERQTGITPAYAGKRERTGRLRRQAKDHPRVCGEKVSSTSPMKCLKGSPPRMRGKVWDILQPLADWGITPAYAGKSCLRLFCGHVEQDHPRVCGEK